MRISKIIILLITIFFVTQLSAIFNDYEPSPRARGMGGAYYSSSDDSYAIFYNPAGLVHADNYLGISYASLFNNEFQILNTIALSMKLPRNFGTLGIGLQAMDVDYQDVNLLSEKIYALSHSFTLMKDIHSELNFGYTLNMYHLSIDSFGDQPAFGINLGMLATLHQRTRVGFAVTNLNNPKVGEDNTHELPQKMALGITYEPYTGVLTSLELKKPFAGESEIHAGTEVRVAKMLSLHFGTRSNPASYSAGLRFNLFDVILDYSYNSHTISGTHHFGLGYKF